MPAESGVSRRPAVPPLAREDHVCDDCKLSYAALPVDSAADLIRAVPAQIDEAVAAIPTELLRVRTSDGTWSVTEYVCHLRDVYIVYTVRLHRSRTEQRPVLEPMLNDLRARRFRYNERDVHAVLDEVGSTAAGCSDEIAKFRAEHWDRVVTRLPGEHRTARWLVRQAAHEGRHHLGDIRTLGNALVEDT